MITKFDTFIFGILGTLIMATIVYAAWLAYDNLESRIKKLESRRSFIELTLPGE